MKKDDIELPPLPVPRTKTDGGIELFAEYSVREYARAAIEPYKQRISELEAQLEAIDHAETNDAWAAWQAGIEHAETRMNRAGRSDSEIELPALPEAEIDDAGAFMSDAQVMSIDSAKEYARVAVEHDRQQRSFTKPSTNQDWLSLDPAVAFHLIERHAENWNDAGAMMQAYLDAHIEADRKRRGESVTCFKCGHAKHGGECVNVAPQPASYCTMGKHACSDPSQCWEPCGELGKSSEHAKVAEPVKVPSEAQSKADRFRNGVARILGLGSEGGRFADTYLLGLIGDLVELADEFHVRDERRIAMRETTYYLLYEHKEGFSSHPKKSDLRKHIKELDAENDRLHALLARYGSKS